MSNVGASSCCSSRFDQIKSTGLVMGCKYGCLVQSQMIFFKPVVIKAGSVEKCFAPGYLLPSNLRSICPRWPIICGSIFTIDNLSSIRLAISSDKNLGKVADTVEIVDICRQYTQRPMKFLVPTSCIGCHKFQAFRIFEKCINLLKLHQTNRCEQCALLCEELRTTGDTLSTIAKLLKDFGAQIVHNWVILRTPYK